jgi:hypothetical protein
MSAIVFILGAGSSHGEHLAVLDSKPRVARSLVKPPLIDGFFRKELWEEISFNGTQIQKDFRIAFDYIGYLKQITDAVGEGAWAKIDLEEIFTFIELEREYRGQESDYGADLTKIRHQLVRYISRILGCCTQNVYGVYSRLLMKSLQDTDSIISFNYDLLLDNEVRAAGNDQGKQHYHRFYSALFERNQPPYKNIYEQTLRKGMFLKMHGSLNWYQCTNGMCPESTRFDPSASQQESLDRAIGIHTTDETCPSCGSETLPLLIPPLLRKPVGENWIFRSVWGLARYRLEMADAVVIVGYSAPPSDFYAKWLFQSTVGVKKEVRVYVVNPANAVDNQNHVAFERRMTAIFPNGYNSEFHSYEQIEAVIAHARKSLARK